MMELAVGSPLIADIALTGALLIALLGAFGLVLFVLGMGTRHGPHHP